jgi:hypothetical protein
MAGRGGTERKVSSTASNSGVDAYLTEAQFCERFQVGRGTAERWRATGAGPLFCRFGPRVVRYRLRDCQDWAAARTFRHRADELAQST